MVDYPKQGEIWWASFYEGWERPSIVVSRNELNRGRLVLVVPYPGGKPVVEQCPGGDDHVPGRRHHRLHKLVKVQVQAVDDTRLVQLLTNLRCFQSNIAFLRADPLRLIKAQKFVVSAL